MTRAPPAERPGAGPQPTRREQPDPGRPRQSLRPLPAPAVRTLAKQGLPPGLVDHLQRDPCPGPPVSPVRRMRKAAAVEADKNTWIKSPILGRPAARSGGTARRPSRSHSGHVAALQRLRAALPAVRAAHQQVGGDRRPSLAHLARGDHRPTATRYAWQLLRSKSGVRCGISLTGRRPPARVLARPRRARRRAARSPAQEHVRRRQVRPARPAPAPVLGIPLCPGDRDY